jgi:hypothetical protein
MDIHGCLCYRPGNISLPILSHSERIPPERRFEDKAGEESGAPGAMQVTRRAVALWLSTDRRMVAVGTVPSPSLSPVESPAITRGFAETAGSNGVIAADAALDLRLPMPALGLSTLIEVVSVGVKGARSTRLHLARDVELSSTNTLFKGSFDFSFFSTKVRSTPALSGKRASADRSIPLK